MPPKQKNSKGRKFAKARGRRRSRGRRRISGFEKSQEDRFIRPIAPTYQWSAGTGYNPVDTTRRMQYFKKQFRDTTKKNSPRLQPSMPRFRSKNLPTRAKPSTGGLSWGQNDRNIRGKRESLTGLAPGTPGTPGTPQTLSPWTNIPPYTPSPHRTFTIHHDTPSPHSPSTIHLDDEVEQGSSKIESEARIESKTSTTSVGGVKKRKTKKRRKTKRKGGRRKTKKRRKTKRGGKRKRRKSRRRR